MANPADVYAKCFAGKPIRNGISVVSRSGSGPNGLVSGLDTLSQPFISMIASGTFDRYLELNDIDGYAFAGENLSNLYKHSYFNSVSGVPV